MLVSWFFQGFENVLKQSSRNVPLTPKCNLTSIVTTQTCLSFLVLGSLTTLSAWAVSAAKLVVPSVGISSWIMGLSTWIVGLSTSILGFTIGTHLSFAIEYCIKRRNKTTIMSYAIEPRINRIQEPIESNNVPITDQEVNIQESTEFYQFWKFLISFSLLFSMLFIGCLILVLFDPDRYRKETLWMPGLWACVGALLRWRLSQLNTLYQFSKYFPIGTFIANTIATGVSAICSGLSIITSLSPCVTSSVSIYKPKQT